MKQSSCDMSAFTTPERHVAFVNVDIVELKMELGHHPFCECGPPVQASDEIQRRTTLNIDDYEATRSPRRTEDDLYLTSAIRRILLSTDSALESPILSDGRFISAKAKMRLQKMERRLQDFHQRCDEMIERLSVLDDEIIHSRLQRRQRRKGLTMEGTTCS